MKPELFGHPRGLTTLATTEMWERFTYYGMRALLIYYLTMEVLLPGHVEHVLFYPQVKAFYEWMSGPLNVQQLGSLIYGTYTGLVYATPLLGGWIADAQSIKPGVRMPPNTLDSSDLQALVQWLESLK